MKKFVCLLLCFVLLFSLGGCKTKEPSDDGSSSLVVEVPKKPVNPLTGVRNMEEGEQYYRPVAIVVNNIKVAQTVQTGVAKADIVYETEAEGGITRLVAVFQNTDKLTQIGPIRSARCAFIDFAHAHGAVFVHHGQEPYHALAQLNHIDSYVIGENNIGIRKPNGLAWEHRLFANTETLRQKLSDQGFKMVNETVKNWQNWADEEDELTLVGGEAISVTVPFSDSYTTVMRYDASTKKYTKYYKDKLVTDAVTGETLSFKNVFVLTTNISPLYSAYVKIDLTQGDGYYFVNGTYVPIKWYKGGTYGAFTFTYVDGTPLTVNAGTSYVCVADKTTSSPIIEFPPAPEPEVSENSVAG